MEHPRERRLTAANTSRESKGHFWARLHKLTSHKPTLAAVCNVPEVRLLNSSGPITGFVLVIPDRVSKTTRGEVWNRILIPKRTYTSRDR
jgi:hypothetical protein